MSIKTNRKEMQNAQKVQTYRSVLGHLTGGFALAASWVWPDHNPVLFCEINKQCQKILDRHWPGVRIVGDIRETVNENIRMSIDIISGGDPCPIRSRARSNGKSKHPDLSGYFLAMVGRVRPRWVVRENVPAPDDIHFCSALEMLGYRTSIIRTDASTFTGQQRVRDIIVGCIDEARTRQFIELHNVNGDTRHSAKILGTRQVIPCLTTHRTRYDSRDCYIYDGKLRILDSHERARFAGYSAGWLNGMSEATQARMFGNTVVPQVAEEIFRAIKTIDEETKNDKL